MLFLIDAQQREKQRDDRRGERERERGRRMGPRGGFLTSCGRLRNSRVLFMPIIILGFFILVIELSTFAEAVVSLFFFFLIKTLMHENIKKVMIRS